METRNNAAPPCATGHPVHGAAGTSAGTTPPVAAAATGAAVAATDTTPRAPGGPTAAQLYQNGRDQLRRGSTSTARTYFQELLSNYPDSDLAPDAQNYIGQSLEREKNVNGADAAYAAVVTKYPDSRVAPNALYKRAQIALQKGNTAEARKLLQEVISRYPKSMEADTRRRATQDAALTAHDDSSRNPMMQAEMPFLDHLEELRWRLFRCAVAIAVGIGVSFGLLVTKKIDVIAMLANRSSRTCIAR